MASHDPRQHELRNRLRELGFDEVRFAAIPPSPKADSSEGLRSWLRDGMHGDMQWMERSLEKRLNPDLVLAGARSIMLLGVNYWTSAPPEAAGVGGSHTVPGGGPHPGSTPKWARYALYEDYHDTIKPALEAAGAALETLYGVSSTDYRYYVDTGPVIERGWAARAGLGFIGKNAMLISRTHGNWLFLAAILTRIDFCPDPAIRRNLAQDAGQRPGRGGDSAIPEPGLLCGKCTRCLDVCPTDAFAAPGVVDARRCISYQTIENRGIIPRELRSAIGNRIYGCDACLEVCPWNRFAAESRRLLLAGRHDLVDLTLPELLALTPEKFAAVFRRTPIKRLKLAGLLRNACIVAGNCGDRSLIPALESLATSYPLPTVRAHAVWAMFRLGAGEQLRAAREREQDSLVLAEYDAEARESAKSGGE